MTATVALPSLGRGPGGGGGTGPGRPTTPQKPPPPPPPPPPTEPPPNQDSLRLVTCEPVYPYLVRAHHLARRPKAYMVLDAYGWAIVVASYDRRRRGLRWDTVARVNAMRGVSASRLRRAALTALTVAARGAS